MRPLDGVARDLDIDERFITYHGKWKAKIDLEAIESNRSTGKLVLVTGMTPTVHGEGKTVVSIGLAMGLNKIGRTAIPCVRQPSLGPVFGIKGGGAGGGRSSVEPAQEINLGLTGDLSAIAAAHNLLSAIVDNHLFHGNDLGMRSDAITWPRTIDIEDRSLRELTAGLGPHNGVPHPARFVITAASEVMAVLCLSRDYSDLKARLGKLIVAYTGSGKAVTASHLGVVGAMGALLRDALKPNLVQTSEGTPALVHGGPFGNIAHGTCSLLSIQLALHRSEYAVVEAGFGSDLGAEKFVDIVAGVGDLTVSCAVIVATIRALKYHGGIDRPDAPDKTAVERGLANLAKHVENVRLLGLRPIVTVNRFLSDTEDEVKAVSEFCRTDSVPFAVSSSFLEGGKGTLDLARLVVQESELPSKMRRVCEPELPLRGQVEGIVKKIYGGEAVSYLPSTAAEMEKLESLGALNWPVCIAKTAASLSDDPAKRGRPRGFVATVHSVEASAGAGFNVVRMGDITLMPGLPTSPAAERIQLSDDGIVTGVE